jgi:hypothetical protein
VRSIITIKGENPMKKIQVVIVLLIGSFTFLITSAVTKTFASQIFQPDPILERVDLVTEDFGGWKYTAYREGPNVTLEIDVNDTTLEGLAAFQSANQRIAQTLAAQTDTVEADIVFEQPLSAAQVSNIVTQYALNVIGFRMRVFDGLNDRITLFGSPYQDQLVSDYHVNLLLDHIREETGEATLLGITTIRAEFTTKNYIDLAADPDVFLVDVTPGFVRNHMQTQHASLLEFEDFLTVSTHPTYWYLESSHLE